MVGLTPTSNLLSTQSEDARKRPELQDGETSWPYLTGNCFEAVVT